VEVAVIFACREFSSVVLEGINHPTSNPPENEPANKNNAKKAIRIFLPVLFIYSPALAIANNYIQEQYHEFVNHL
jgi:hypothetical protein